MTMAGVVLIAATGCGASSSDYMQPAAGPTPPSAKNATLLLAADIEQILGKSRVLTVWDENRRFLGQLFEHSMFQVDLPPGRHAFAMEDLGFVTQFMKPGQKLEFRGLRSRATPNGFTAALAPGDAG
jgi:hypothetical protein